LTPTATLFELHRDERPAEVLRPGEALARFWEARGRSVFEAAGAYWGFFSRLHHICLPFDRALAPDRRALSEALRDAGVLAARYSTESGRGVQSGAWVARTAGGFSMTRLDRTHRKLVRRGLQRCDVRSIDPDELRALGRELNGSMLKRQHRADPELTDPVRWARFTAAVAACPEISVLGAFVDGRLSGYHVSCRDGRWVHGLYKASLTEHLEHGTNPALEFTFLSRAAQNPNVDGVTAGVLALGDVPHDRYKQGMGFELVPQRVAVEVNPRMRPFLAAGEKLGAAVFRARPRSARWRGVAATLRAAREGAK
jgi:hypothetical protein